MSVNHSARSGGIIRIFFSIFFNTKVCCVFPLESPHRGDSNEDTQSAIFNIPNLQLWDFSKGLKNEFKTAVAQEPSVFEPLKFHCI